MIVNVTGATFEAEVLKSDKPVLVDFWAAWCGPCRMMAPVIEQFTAEHPEVKVCKVNVDEEQQLAARYNILSIPTVIAYKDGQAVNQSVGVVPKANLAKLFQ